MHRFFEYNYIIIINKVRYYQYYNKWEVVHLINTNNKTLELHSSNKNRTNNMQ